MSQQGDSLSAYWDEQRRMMGRRPRGRAEVRETVAEAEPQPMLPKQEPEPASPAGQGGPLGLDEMRAKAERVGAWLLETDISHERWAEGLRVYVKLQEEIQALEDGPWHSLRQPGDEYRRVVTFPADYPGPLLEGTWERLPDGHIEARLSLFQLRIMRELRDIQQGEPLQPAAVDLTEEQTAQAPLLEPLIWLSEQQAPLLRPGWIARLQDVLPEAGEPYEARLLSILDTRTQEGVKGSSWEQMLCLWQRLDNGQCFRQIVEIA